MVMNSLHLFLVWKTLSPSFLKNSFAKYSWLAFSFSFSTLNLLCHFFGLKSFSEKSAKSYMLMWNPLYLTNYFSFASFKTSRLWLLAIHLQCVFGVGIFQLILFGTPGFLDLDVLFPSQFREVLSHYFFSFLLQVGEAFSYYFFQ